MIKKPKGQNRVPGIVSVDPWLSVCQSWVWLPDGVVSHPVRLYCQGSPGIIRSYDAATLNV